jgi:hypothetical protein
MFIPPVKDCCVHQKQDREGHQRTSEPNDLNNRVFVAGASGVIGRRLCPVLVDDGGLQFRKSREAFASHS